MKKNRFTEEQIMRILRLAWVADIGHLFHRLSTPAQMRLVLRPSPAISIPDLFAIAEVSWSIEAGH